MLKSLYIKNFAIIKETEINFDKGLNIITGESGSGKSIIFEALNIILGNRASFEYIRHGEDKAIIEAVFLNDKISFDLDKQIIENEFIVRKELRKSGVSRTFLNDTPVKIQDLKKLTNKLADFHSQDENNILSNKGIHIEYYDSSNDLDKDKKNFKTEYKQLLKKYSLLNTLKQKKKEADSKKDYYEFQLNEINKINPEENELNELREKLDILENSEEIHDISEETKSLTTGKRESLLSQLNSLKKNLIHLSKFDKGFTNYLDEIESALITIQGIDDYTVNFSSDIELNPFELNEIRNRFLKLNGLAKKYGSFEEVFIKKDFFENELDQLSTYDLDIIDLEKEIINMELKVGDIANKIHKKRLDFIKEFESLIEEKLKKLDIKYPTFEVKLSIAKCSSNYTPKCKIKEDYYELNHNGIDKVEFYASLNKGEKTKPIAEFASGGELSRILLSIKSLNKYSEYFKTLILDEIDTGISGKTSLLVGKLMKEISLNEQIIAITHSPQIAALADVNFRTRKENLESKTISIIDKLDKNTKVVEIAKLISGNTYTEASLKNAEELINSN